MPTISNTFESGLSNGTSVTTGNSGAVAAGTPFDAVGTGAGTSIVYSTTHPAHGSLGALITIGVSAAQPAYVEWSTALLASSTSATTWARSLFASMIRALTPG